MAVLTVATVVQGAWLTPSAKLAQGLTSETGKSLLHVSDRLSFTFLELRLIEGLPLLFWLGSFGCTSVEVLSELPLSSPRGGGPRVRVASGPENRRWERAGEGPRFGPLPAQYC